MRWVLFFLAALPLAFGAAACGDDADDGGGDGGTDNGDTSPLPTDDPRIAEIAGVAGLATNAFASAGPEGLYDYVAVQVAARCTSQQLAAAMADQELPSGFLAVDAVSFQGDGAHAAVRLKFGDDEREAEWVFMPAPGNTWRIANMPGLEECTS